MNEHLTDEMVGKVVAEAQRITNQKDKELSREQVEEILKELSLPPELLDDAITQVYRRKAQAEEQKRNRTLIIGVVSAIVILVGGMFFFQRQQQQQLDRITVQTDRISLNGNTNISIVSRQNKAELSYQITLNDAPIGQKLPITCDWIDSKGIVVNQNRYQTKPVKTSVWNTQCRYSLSENATVGKWQVKAFINDRVISDAQFEVQ